MRRLRLAAAVAAVLFLAVSSSGRGAAAAARPRVILVGWDGADWTLLDPLVKEGKLPNLARLLAAGRSWELSTYQPMASPLVWTTIATGRNPVDHGVDDFQEYDLKARVRIPITSRSRKVPAIWNLASSRGVTVGVVGWWATWPAEKVNGFLVSDRSSPVLFDPETLARSPALTWPEGLADGVRIVGKREGAPGYEEVAKALAVSRGEFDAAVAAKKDLQDPASGYQKILGSTRVYGRVALDLYDREKPELLMVYFEGTDEIGHLLARYHPPKLPSVSDEDFRKYSGGVVAYYAEADRLLGEFLARAERDGATLVLVSDHGFKWGSERPGAYSSIKSDTAFLWHISPGVLAAAGPAVVRSPSRGKASVFDVTPTLCRLLGLPRDPAFEGRPVEGLDGRRLPAMPRAVSWAKATKVERLSLPTGEPTDRKAAEEFTRKLISLGYLTGSEASAVDARPPERAGTETAAGLQNAATFLRVQGRVQESLVWYRRALEVNPKYSTAWMNLSTALESLSRWDDSDEALIQAVRFGYNDPEATVYRRVASYLARAEKDGRARARLVSFLKKAVDAFPENDRYRSSLGKVLFENKDCASADPIFRDLVARRPSDVESLNLNALTSWCLGKTAEAKALFLRSLALDPKQGIVKEGLAQLERGGNVSR